MVPFRPSDNDHARGMCRRHRRGPCCRATVVTVRPLAFFPATVITVLDGSIFGPVWGGILTIIGSNLSASLAYTVAFFLGKGVLDESSESTGIVKRYADRMRNNSFETVLIMCFLFLPYDLVNYLAGFLHIRYIPFILGIILGSLPGTMTFVLAGASLKINDIFRDSFEPSLNLWTLVASVVLLVSSIACSTWLKQREAERLAQSEEMDSEQARHERESL